MNVYRIAASELSELSQCSALPDIELARLQQTTPLHSQFLALVVNLLDGRNPNW